MQWIITHLSTMTPIGAYVWLFTILLLCGFGLPIPEDISLIAAGYFAWRGDQGLYPGLSVHKAFVVCLFAVLAGEWCGVPVRAVAKRNVDAFETPRQAAVQRFTHRRATHVIADRRLADPGRLADKPPAHPQSMRQTQNVAYLPHRHSLRWHRSPPGCQGDRSADSTVDGSASTPPSPAVRLHRIAVPLAVESLSALHRIPHIRE